MKVTATCHIAGRGLVIVTDEAFSASAAERACGCTRIGILGDRETSDLEISDVESVLVRGGREVLGFLIADATGKGAHDWVGREIQLH